MKNPPALILILFMAGCGQHLDKMPLVTARPIHVGTGQLIPIDFSDSNYKGTEFYAKDTSTTDGWKIKYFVKDDSTKYKDLFIQWTNGTSTGIFPFAEVLTFRRYFIPKFKGENKLHIFLTHACATNCSAVLTLSKETKPKAIDFPSLVDYDIKKGLIVFIPDSSYILGKFEVKIADLNRHKEKSILFKNICNNADLSCVDSVSFSDKYVRLSAFVIDKNDTSRTKFIRENYNVKLD